MRTDKLVYAASARCPCGAGLAYNRLVDPMENGWDCSAILLGEAIPSGQPGSVTHTAVLPFVFWEIRSEVQPGAGTTRPQ